MEQVEQFRRDLRRALEDFSEHSSSEQRQILLTAIHNFEEEVSAHVDGAYLRQLLSTARQCLQDDALAGGQLENALIDLRSATQLGCETPSLPAWETAAVADETPAVKGNGEDHP